MISGEEQYLTKPILLMRYHLILIYCSALVLYNDIIVEYTSPSKLAVANIVGGQEVMHVISS